MTILRVACYERVSTDEQASRGFSIDAQIDNLKEYCEKEGMKIVDHYTDEGKSGSLPPLKRPALHRLLEDVQAGKIDMILFTKLDRWFRSVKEYFKVQDILDSHKVEWKAIHEDYDTTTANGRMAITIFLAIAQNEREKASERVKRVFSHKRKEKEACFGGPYLPFGYMKEKDADGINRLVKNPAEKQMCEEFWRILIEHDSINMAIHHMRNVYGVKKDPSTWLLMTRKTFYYGMYDGIEDFCEPYVTKEEWDKVQKSADTRKQDTKPKRVYLFTGLMHCPKCGATLSSSYTISKYKDKGYECRMYRCRHKNKGCDYKRNISESTMEKMLLAKLPELIQKEIAAAEVKKNALVDKPKYNIVNLRERLRSLNDSYMAGNKTDEEYIAEGAEIKKLIAIAEKEVPQSERDLTPLKELLDASFLSIYSEQERLEKRHFWQGLIAEIKLDDNKIEDVIFRF